MFVGIKLQNSLLISNSLSTYITASVTPFKATLKFCSCGQIQHGAEVINVNNTAAAYPTHEHNRTTES